MKNELVSVIMPTYNRGYTIKIAIDSILNQTYENLEFIIIDDCSTDNTTEIIKTYNDKRIKYIKLKKNSGANYARNKGLEIAKGKYITFQDSDDFSYNTRIEEELKYLKESKSDIVFSSFRKINDEKTKTIPKNKIFDKNVHQELLNGNFITTQVLLGKKNVFDDITFDNDLPRFQDWDLVIRISKKYKISHYNKVLLDMYIQSDSITKNHEKGINALIKILEKYNFELSNKQKCRINFRIGIFKILSNEDATLNFKKGLNYHKNIEYLLIYFLYKIGLFKYIYKLLKK